MISPNIYLNIKTFEIMKSIFQKQMLFETRRIPLL